MKIQYLLIICTFVFGCRLNFAAGEFVSVSENMYKVEYLIDSNSSGRYFDVRYFKNDTLHQISGTNPNLSVADGCHFDTNGNCNWSAIYTWYFKPLVHYTKYSGKSDTSMDLKNIWITIKQPPCQNIDTVTAAFANIYNSKIDNKICGEIKSNPFTLEQIYSVSIYNKEIKPLRTSNRFIRFKNKIYNILGRIKNKIDG